MGILARLRLAKIRTMARPNSPDMPPKRTKKVRLGIIITSVMKIHHPSDVSIAFTKSFSAMINSKTKGIVTNIAIV